MGEVSTKNKVRGTKYESETNVEFRTLIEECRSSAYCTKYHLLSKMEVLRLDTSDLILFLCTWYIVLCTWYLVHQTSIPAIVAVIKQAREAAINALMPKRLRLPC